MQPAIEEPSEAIHHWFELTYANYLVLPRSILQSLPNDIQEELVAALRRIEGYYTGCRIPIAGTYDVRVRGDKGRFRHDPFSDYERGRRVVTPEEVKGWGSG